MPHALDQPDCGKRVTAQFEEIVMSAHAVQIQNLGKERRQQKLPVADWRFIAALRIGACIRSGQGIAVKLAIGRQRQSP